MRYKYIYIDALNQITPKIVIEYCVSLEKFTQKLIAILNLCTNEKPKAKQAHISGH